MDETTPFRTRAAQIIPGPEATSALFALREALEVEHGRALIYELIAPVDGHPWVARALPALASYVRSKKFGVLGGRALRFAVWSGDVVLVLESGPFFEAVGEVLALERPALEAHLQALIAARAEA